MYFGIVPYVASSVPFSPALQLVVCRLICMGSKGWDESRPAQSMALTGTKCLWERNSPVTLASKHWCPCNIAVSKALKYSNFELHQKFLFLFSHATVYLGFIGHWLVCDCICLSCSVSVSIASN